MTNFLDKNADALEALANKTPLTFPMSAYLDFAAAKKVVITKEIVREVEEAYFGRFDTEEEFIQAVKDDFGSYWYPTREKIYEDFISANNRYYKVK